jgi:hypothetical protein
MDHGGSGHRLSVCLIPEVLRGEVHLGALNIVGFGRTMSTVAVAVDTATIESNGR